MSPSATSPEEPAPDGAAEAGAAGREPTARAVRRERFRTILGALTVLACLAVAVFYGLSAPDPDLHPGARGVALRWGVPTLWVLLAVTLTTWTMRLPEKLTRLLSYLVLACFVFYMVLRAW
ncbi:MAG TPA: hypothetical protein VK095_01010 [Beutenbergiaceae bacterium]|nr:hypothetical protein [Beutenbergiaceae bacterium]